MSAILTRLIPSHWIQEEPWRDPYQAPYTFSVDTAWFKTTPANHRQAGKIIQYYRTVWLESSLIHKSISLLVELRVTQQNPMSTLCLHLCSLPSAADTLAPVESSILLFLLPPEQQGYAMWLFPVFRPCMAHALSHLLHSLYQINLWFVQSKVLPLSCPSDVGTFLFICHKQKSKDQRGWRSALTQLTICLRLHSTWPFSSHPTSANATASNTVKSLPNTWVSSSSLPPASPPTLSSIVTSPVCPKHPGPSQHHSHPQRHLASTLWTHSAPKQPETKESLVTPLLKPA